MAAIAKATGSRYVSFENLYMYGDPNGKALAEDLPYAAKTKKGQVRAAMAADLLAMHAAGDLQVAIGRGSDYFGPRGTTQSPFGDLVIGAALAGKAARVIGDSDQPHTYSYLPDIGRTLVTLGTRGEALGQVWHVPNAPARSTREIIGLIGTQLGKEVRVRVAPDWLLRAMGVFNPTLREIVEMLYEFHKPFIVDSSKFEKAFGIGPTPLEESIPTTLSWFCRSQYPNRASSLTSRDEMEQNGPVAFTKVANGDPASLTVPKGAPGNSPRTAGTPEVNPNTKSLYRSAGFLRLAESPRLTLGWAAGLHRAVARLEHGEQSEGHETESQDREQELPGRLRQDRMQRTVQALPLWVEGHGRVREQTPHSPDGNALGDVPDLAQPCHTLACDWRHRQSGDLLEEGLLDALDYVGYANTDDDDSGYDDHHSSGGQRKQTRRGLLLLPRT